MLLTTAQIKPKSFQSRGNSFFTRGGCVSCLRACLGTRLLPQSYQYPNFSEGADRVGGQLRGDKEGPFNGVTKSGRVWRKMPESDIRSVGITKSVAVSSIYHSVSSSVIIILLGQWQCHQLVNRLAGVSSTCHSVSGSVTSLSLCRRQCNQPVTRSAAV